MDYIDIRYHNIGIQIVDTVYQGKLNKNKTQKMRNHLYFMFTPI